MLAPSPEAVSKDHQAGITSSLAMGREKALSNRAGHLHRGYSEEPPPAQGLLPSAPSIYLLSSLAEWPASPKSTCYSCGFFQVIIQSPTHRPLWPQGPRRPRRQERTVGLCYHPHAGPCLPEKPWSPGPVCSVPAPSSPLFPPGSLFPLPAFWHRP